MMAKWNICSIYRVLCYHRYWYDNGLLFPDVATVFIALDEAVQENGCLQVRSGLKML